MTPAQRAAAAAVAATRRLRGVPVTFDRGDISLEISKAVKGETIWERREAGEGIRLGDRSTDWIIPASDLIAGGVQLTPTRDDTFTTADGTVFRVMPYGPDRLCWRWHDRDGQTTYRIHTRER